MTDSNREWGQYTDEVIRRRIFRGLLIKELCEDPVIHPITNQILDIDDGKTLKKLDQMLWIMEQLCVNADRLKIIAEKCFGPK